MTPMLFFLLGLAGVLIAGLFGQVKKIGGLVEALTQRVLTLERRLQTAEPPPAPEKVAIPPSPLLATPPMDSPGRVPDERKLVPPVPSKPPPLPPPLPPTPAPATPFNWEAFMGVKLFAWLGGLALFLGVVFMVKYSFENNLITPLGRIVIGGAVGLALVATGWWLARGRYRATAQSLCATGIVILYADLFAAHSFYGLISLTTAFFAMSAVTLGSFLLAVGLDAQVIVILGLLGGFLTPVVASERCDNAPALFLYIALLDLGVAAVALRKRWHYLVLLAAIGTALTQLGWAIQFFNAARGGRAFWIFLGFEALFLAFYFCGRFALRSAGIDVARNERSDARSPRFAERSVYNASDLTEYLDRCRRRRRGVYRSRILFLAPGRPRTRASADFFLQLRLSRGCRRSRAAGDGSGASRDRVRRRRPDIHSGGGMDRVVCATRAALGCARRHRHLRAPARRDGSGFSLASGHAAAHRRRHRHALPAPDHFG